MIPKHLFIIYDVCCMFSSCLLALELKSEHMAQRKHVLQYHITHHMHINGKWTELGLNFNDGVSFDVQSYCALYQPVYISVKNKNKLTIRLNIVRYTHYDILPSVIGTVKSKIALLQLWSQDICKYDYSFSSIALAHFSKQSNFKFNCHNRLPVHHNSIACLQKVVTHPKHCVSKFANGTNIKSVFVIV